MKAVSPAPWPEYMDIAMLARYTSLSEGTIRGLMRAPDPLPSFTVGRSRRFLRLAIDTWLRRRAGASQAVDNVLEEIRFARSR